MFLSQPLPQNSNRMWPLPQYDVQFKLMHNELKCT